jgi:MFS family permease
MEKKLKSLLESPIARWGILLLLGFILSANYYFYDAFSSLKSLLTEEFAFTNTQYGLFVSFYSIPNTFLLMAVFGGIILDKIGIRRTGFTFVFFMALGAVLTAYGASDVYRGGGVGYSFMSSILPKYSPELKMMLVGRFFYGLGAETSIVVVSKILVKWFMGKDMALGYGATQIILRNSQRIKK